MSKISAEAVGIIRGLYDAVARRRNGVPRHASTGGGGDAPPAGVPRGMTVRRTLALALAGAVLATACAGGPHAARPQGGPPVPSSRAGLSTDTAFVTVVRATAVGSTSARLGTREGASVLAAAWRLIGTVPSAAPEPGGPRFLVNLRLNASLVDVSIWDPQTLVIAGRRFANVSGIVIPLTGSWEGRVFIVREGVVDVSPALAPADVASFETAVEAAGGHS
ncbi:MAG TPA: hypothetical protein VK587_08020 [bacterium]|nr:hypothetical protein [bacterium]